MYKASFGKSGENNRFTLRFPILDVNTHFLFDTSVPERSLFRHEFSTFN